MEVHMFSQQMKTVLMSAHDEVLSPRVKQTYETNKHHCPSPLTKGDLVYISTKNNSLPKGVAWKLTPKFIGPYRIIEDYHNNSYKIDLPSHLKQWEVLPVFHSSYLRIYMLNNNQLFPR